MTAQIMNQNGFIKIGQDTIAQIAGQAALECYGVVGMGAKSFKDGLVHILKKESLTKGVHVYIENNQLTIDLHIIVEYGTNIGAISESLISTVTYRIKDMLGFGVKNVNVFVIGVRV